MRWLDSARWLALSGLVMVLDQASKSVITEAFKLGESLRITSYFDLVLVLNRGAAFSFLSDAGGWQRWFFIVLATAISAWIVRMIIGHASERLLSTALAMVLGGALGNVIDRLQHGAVVDFLYFHVAEYYWPAFNLADSAITVGVALLLWQQWRPGFKSES
ncbi:MAG: signal peptidase II [Proteobacteria bacterium]|nr:signal peptidase II [Pseudomonadota bacterium]